MPSSAACFVAGDRSGPDIYAHLDKDENPDMHKYRGDGDFRFSCGNGDDRQPTMDLRKGTLSKACSADVQATYPLNRSVPGPSAAKPC